MSKTNPQIEEQLDKLAGICCESLDGQHSALGEESEALLKAMLMSGYARMVERSLQQDLESRIKQGCPRSTLHRGGEVSAMTAQLAKRFEELKRWESRQPNRRDRPKAANFSSASDA